MENSGNETSFTSSLQSDDTDSYPNFRGNLWETNLYKVVDILLKLVNEIECQQRLPHQL